MTNKDDITSNHKFGTFGGVFTPCTLTILGVIMFLRYGQVVGQAGLFWALIILLVAKVITLLTALSLSAVATNIRVKGGGAYFLISRSLGVEFGGSIGVVFFLAQAISVALYIIGFTEAFIDAFPNTLCVNIPLINQTLNATWIASLSNFVVFICVIFGAKWAIKIQYAILAILALSLISFFAGAFPHMSLETLSQNMNPQYNTDSNLFIMFALFFPAVTGVMAGANMSGDLKDPSRSIPKGTLIAIVFTGAVYFLQAVVLASTTSQQTLINNNLIMKEISLSSTLVTMGIFAATLSSAIGSMIGSPRILQAFAKDNVFEFLRFFSRGSTKGNEPRRATVLTFVIAQCCIFLGDLDNIAPIITMFFMITYGTLNLSTFYESITKNPSYRPRFRFSHWSTALLGAIGCLIVMFLIDPVWAIISILCMGVLHYIISCKEIKARWGDVQSGVAFERARRNLLLLEDENYHPKNWRPIIIAATSGAWNKIHLAVYGHWLTAGHGILTLAQILVGDVRDQFERRSNLEKMLRKYIRDQEINAFATVVVAKSVAESIDALVQCHGLGGFHANTILFNWNKDPEQRPSFASNLRTVASLGKSIVAIKYDENQDAWNLDQGLIDIWWRGRTNGQLMLLLSYLLTKNPEWRTRSIRLFRIINSDGGKQEAVNNLHSLIEDARIDAKVQVIVAENVLETIVNTSKDSALVFLGFTPPKKEFETGFFEAMEQYTEKLKTIVFVSSAGGMELEV